VQRIALVTEDLSRYAERSQLPERVTLHDRRDLDAVQKELREVPGVSVLIYDQTCAAEKRRRRKKGEYPTPTRRVFINEAVCEGCGDCGVQSNCTSILPVETEVGRKRAIDQSSCNQDYSCVKGFCPSFVTVEGGAPRKSRNGQADRSGRDPAGALPALPDPAPAPLGAQPYNILITGIGGTGVITIGALLGMAAHLEAKGTSALDMTGMSQNSAVVIRITGLGGRPCPAHRDRRGRPDPRLRHADRRRAGRGIKNTARPHGGGDQPAPAAAGTVHPKPRLALPGGRNPRTDRRVRRRQIAFHRCDPAGHGAAGGFDRDQPVHAGLRVPEGPDPPA
jgi:hypothetical protein